MALFLDDKQMAESTATNKKAAEQDAARKTLEGLGLLS
jgi:dsRNA-specific ribonuclease